MSSPVNAFFLMKCDPGFRPKKKKKIHQTPIIIKKNQASNMKRKQKPISY